MLTKWMNNFQKKEKFWDHWRKNFIEEEKAQICVPWSIRKRTVSSFFLKVQQTSFFFEFSNSVTRLGFSSFKFSSSCCKYGSTHLPEGMSWALDISDKKAEQIATRYTLCH